MHWVLRVHRLEEAADEAVGIVQADGGQCVGAVGRQVRDMATERTHLRDSLIRMIRMMPS
ncbi:hypothetical protein ACWD4O_46645 [Streptomyces sp. NPDC002623]